MKTTDLFAPRLVPGLALVVAVALLGAGCGSGGGGPAPVINDPPTLAFQTPTLLVLMGGRIGTQQRCTLVAGRAKINVGVAQQMREIRVVRAVTPQTGA